MVASLSTADQNRNPYYPALFMSCDYQNVPRPSQSLDACLPALASFTLAGFAASARCIFVSKNYLAPHSCSSCGVTVAAELAPSFSQQTR